MITRTNPWENLTWTCHVCGEERPDEKISVHKKDASEESGLPKGTFMMNFRYCNDNDDCIEKVKTKDKF